MTRISLTSYSLLVIDRMWPLGSSVNGLYTSLREIVILRNAVGYRHPYVQLIDDNVVCLFCFTHKFYFVMNMRKVETYKKLLE